MKLTIERNPLVDAVAQVRGYAKGNTIPILGNLLLKAEGQKLSMLAHDCYACAEANVGAEVTADGTCTVSADTFYRLAKEFTKGSHVAFSLEASGVVIQCGRSRYSLPVLPATDFPEKLRVKEPKWLALSDTDVAQLFKRPLPIVAEDAKAPILGGIHLCADERKNLCAVSTDRGRLFRFSTEVKFGKLPPVTIPLLACDAITKIGAGEIAWDAHVISFRNDGVTFASKFLDEKYVDYLRAIPEPAPNFIEIDRLELLQAMERLNLVSGARGVELAWNDDPTQFLASTPGGEGTEAIDCLSVSQGPGSVMVLPWVLAGSLEAIRGEKVRFVASEKEYGPFRLIDPKEPDTIVVQMPCELGRPRISKAA